MLRAVFVRTLRSGVTYEQFKAAWVPEGTAGNYQARAWVSRNVANDRQVITIVEFDVPITEIGATVASLVRADARDRLSEIIESSELEAVFEDVFDETSL